MLIEFTLNNKEVSADVPAYTPVSQLLREHFKLYSLKDIRKGEQLGLSAILLERELVYGSIIPSFQIRNNKIMTMEGYALQPDFEDVFKGFKQAGVYLCDYCAPARTLCTGAMLQKFPRPDRTEVLEIIKTVNCSCTPYETLRRGILSAARFRQRRLN